MLSTLSATNSTITPWLNTTEVVRAPEIRIIDASPDDADMIAFSVADAIGEELVRQMAKNKTRDDVVEILARLARRDDTQYSYLNTRIALASDGKKAGVCISYDGSCLTSLRRPFFQEAIENLGWEISPELIDTIPGETSPEEYYLDTLAVLPEYRGQGIASVLIADARNKAQNARLPLGLLVADDNPHAKALYEKIGFKFVGHRLFAGQIMSNLRLPLLESNK